MRRALIFVVAVGLAANFPVTGGEPELYVAHFLIAALVAVSVLATMHTSGWRDVDTRPAVLLAVSAVALYALAGVGGPRFFGDFAKLVVMLAGFYGFSLVIVNWGLSPRMLAAGIVVGVLGSTLLLVNPVNAWQTLVTLSLQSRLDIRSLGGFNVYAFLVSLALVALVHVAVGWWRRGARLLAAGGLVAGTVYLGAFLVATFSRGGMVSLVAGIATYLLLAGSARRVLTLLGISLATAAVFTLAVVELPPGVLDRYLFVDDVTGSGRTAIWSYLLDRWRDTPLTVLFGHGPGTIEFYRAEHVIESAHNAYVDVLFQYGLIGLGGLLVWIGWVAANLTRAPRGDDRALLAALFAQVVFGSAVDSYWNASQVGWLVALVGAAAQFGLRAPAPADQSMTPGTT